MKGMGDRHPPTAIRHANREDADAIAAVHVTAWRESYAGLLPDAMLAALSVEKRAEGWRRVLAEPDPTIGTAVVVACSPGGAIVGFGSCGRQRAPLLAKRGFEGEFQAIYVLRTAQRRGTGRALMAAMARDLAGCGLMGATLWVLEGNAAARAFYEAQGGAVVGRRDDRHSEQFVFREVAYGWAVLSRLAEIAIR